MQLRENLVCGCTMAFRTNLKKLVLPISGDGPLIHDGWIVLLIAAVGEIDFINRPLQKYRQHFPRNRNFPHRELSRMRELWQPVGADYNRAAEATRRLFLRATRCQRLPIY